MGHKDVHTRPHAEVRGLMDSTADFGIFARTSPAKLASVAKAMADKSLKAYHKGFHIQGRKYPQQQHLQSPLTGFATQLTSKPQTQTSKPQTPNPKPETLNPNLKPQTLNPINPKPGSPDGSLAPAWANVPFAQNAHATHNAVGDEGQGLGLEGLQKKSNHPGL